MKKYLFLFALLTFMACEDKEGGDPIVPDHSVEFNTEEVVFDVVKAYETEEGYLVHLAEAASLANPRVLWIILSDKESQNYTAAESVMATDEAKTAFYFDTGATVPLKSSSGTLEISVNGSTISGTFSAVLADNGGTFSEGKFENVPISQESILDFQTISATDLNGVPMADEDPNDWKVGAFMGIEKTPFLQFDPLSGVLGSEQTVRQAYPNPFTGTFFWGFETSFVPQLELVLVNQNFEIIVTFSDIDNLQVGINEFAFTLPETFPVSNGDHYRLFYRISSTTSDEIITGYGDLRYSL